MKEAGTMEFKRLCLVFLAFSSALIGSVNADVKLHLCPPSRAYFSSLNAGDTFALDMMAEADPPGATMFVFTVAWTPGDCVEFVHPTSEGSSELAMTGFFPQSSPDSTRLSGIAPDWTSPEVAGSPGATPEIAVFTAPAANYTGPDSLARITFRKLSASYPTFNLADAKAAQYLGGSETTWLTVTYNVPYVNIDTGNAMMSGPMLSQATAVVVNIGGNDYRADVLADVWTLDIKAVTPELAPQSITVKALQNGSLLSSFTTTDFVRPAGWYRSAADHGENPADSNGDGSLTSLDLMMLAQAYGSSAGRTGYDFRCDYNADGVVNLTDLLIFGLSYRR